MSTLTIRIEHGDEHAEWAYKIAGTYAGDDMSAVEKRAAKHLSRLGHALDPSAYEGLRRDLMDSIAGKVSSAIRTVLPKAIADNTGELDVPPPDDNPTPGDLDCPCAA